MGEHLVVQIAMDVLRGLAHIHHKGVIHKDVKCANILCGPDSYKIADFGISAIEDSFVHSVSPTMDTTSTHADPIGTMHYMSFEQHRRKTTPLARVVAPK